MLARQRPLLQLSSRLCPHTQYLRQYSASATILHSSLVEKTSFAKTRFYSCQRPLHQSGGYEYDSRVSSNALSEHDDDDDEDGEEEDSEGLFADEDEESDEEHSSSTQSITKEPVIDRFGRAYGTGRRKTSIARVWVKRGAGEFIVNDRELVDYFQSLQRMHAIEAFQASKTAGLFDVWCTVKGGGMSGQAGAVRLGIARALEAFNPQLRPALSRAGMLTRDSRRVERKKFGQKKARKKFQVR